MSDRENYPLLSSLAESRPDGNRTKQEAVRLFEELESIRTQLQELEAFRIEKMYSDWFDQLDLTTEDAEAILDPENVVACACMGSPFGEGVCRCQLSIWAAERKLGRPYRKWEYNGRITRFPSAKTEK